MPDTSFVRPTGACLALALFALALGGFGIGTTEFATMGVLPEISDDLHASIPLDGAPDLAVRARGRRRGTAARGARRAAAA